MRLTLIAALLALAAPVHADPDKTAGAAEAQAGQKLYEDNQFKDAAAHFAHAYELDPQPAYLFDAAQAYRFAKDCTNAAKLYRQFVDVAKQAQNLDKVKRYITEMDECSTVQPSAPQPVQPRVEPTPPQEPLPPRDVPDGDPGAGKRHLGIALGVLGVVGIAAGVHYTIEVGKDNDNADSCRSTSSCSMMRINQVNSDGDKHHWLAVGGYSLGGAAIVGGIVLYVLGKSSATSEHGVTLVPTRNGAALGFTF